MCTGFEPAIAAELFGGAAAATEAVGAGAALLGTGAGLGEAFLGADVLGGLGAAGGELFGGIGAGAFEAAGLGWGSGVAETGVLDGLAGAGFGGSGLGAGFAGNYDSGNFISNIRQLASYANPALSAVSGVTGLKRAGDLQQQAVQLGKGADPWGTSGGRAVADAQLRQLLVNPSSVAASDPAYKLRIQGAQRANAGSGQDSGAMSVAGANASTDWYNQRVAQLAGMAGASINPANGAQIQLGGTEAANSLTSSSLGSLGYATGRLVGDGGLLQPQQQQLLNFALTQAMK
jgi:hypothetical protein